MRIKSETRKCSTRDMRIVYRKRSPVKMLGAEVAFSFLFIWQQAGEGLMCPAKQNTNTPIHC